MTKQISTHFFSKTYSKPIPQWFLAVETAMLKIYSTVYYYTLKKQILTPILIKLIMNENHIPLALLYSNVILHMFIFLTNLNPFGLVHTKFLIEWPMLHMNFLHKMVLHYTFEVII